MLFLFSDQELTVTEDTNQSSTQDPNSSDLFSNMDFVHSQTDKNQKENESANFLRDKEIDNEILLFYIYRGFYFLNSFFKSNLE